MLRTISILLVALAGLFAMTAGADAARRPAMKIQVTAGKPSEFHFKLSNPAARKGVVVFRVSNRGLLPHDFKIAGKTTPLLKPGKAATLRVVFRRAGTYRYQCTVSGHAAAGMRGILRVR